MKPRLGDIISLSRQRRRALSRRARKSADAALRIRYLIIVLLAEGHSSVDIENLLKVARAHVSRTARRFREGGESGLADQREDNGSRKVDDRFLTKLHALLSAPPTAHGWARSSWTRELLALEMQRQTGVRVSRSTIGFYLRALRARWGRTRPMVLCPWPRARRLRRLREIRELLSRSKASEEVFYVDEVDVDLNPKIGPDWMLPNEQPRILTPGKNAKWYLAGALNARSGNVVWVEGDQKRSWLFLNLMRALLKTYRRARVLHVILDNYIIHKSRITRMALQEWGDRIRLHFLPPYCPDENRIEHLWLQLHANVTRNHRCSTLNKLLARVRRFLRDATPFPGSRPSLARLRLAD
jgi:transposase